MTMTTKIITFNWFELENLLLRVWNLTTVPFYCEEVDYRPQQRPQECFRRQGRRERKSAHARAFVPRIPTSPFTEPVLSLQKAQMIIKWN